MELTRPNLFLNPHPRYGPLREILRLSLAFFENSVLPILKQNPETQKWLETIFGSDVKESLNDIKEILNAIVNHQIPAITTYDSRSALINQEMGSVGFEPTIATAPG